jgi:phosphoribosylformylglycinamidine synthase
MKVLHFFRYPGLPSTSLDSLLASARAQVLDSVKGLDSEYCFNVLLTRDLEPMELEILRWLLAETFEPDGFGRNSHLNPKRGQIIEVGPRLSFSTAWSTNAVAVCSACGLDAVRRIERSRRYLVSCSAPFSDQQLEDFLPLVHDRMTECRYPSPLTSLVPISLPSHQLRAGRHTRAGASGSGARAGSSRPRADRS